MLFPIKRFSLSDEGNGANRIQHANRIESSRNGESSQIRSSDIKATRS